MYVCMYVCMYICMYVCVCMYVCIHVKLIFFLAGTLTPGVICIPICIWIIISVK